MTATISRADDADAAVGIVGLGGIASVAGVVGGIGGTAARRASRVRGFSRWRALAVAVFAIVLAVEIVLVEPYLARATRALSDPDARWLTLAVVAEVVSMGAFARVQRQMLSAGGQRAPMRRMLALTYAANAVSVSLPGGTAISSGYVFRRLRSWGASVPAAGFTVLASGLLSTASFALLAIACAVFAGRGGLGSLLVIAGVLAALLATVYARRHRGSGLLVRVASRGLVRGNRLLRRAPDAGVSALQRFVRELGAIKPRSRDWLAGLSFAGVNWVADLVCLVACCHAVGADRSTLVLVSVAYVAGMSASSVSLLPGGFGVVDAAMIFALTSGGVSTVSATAGVLLYRLVSFALIVALGWIVWAISWLAERRRARAVDLEVAFALEP